MKPASVRLSLIGIALLIASVGLKAVLVRSDVTIDHQRVAYDLARSYSTQGSSAVVERGTWGEYVKIDKGNCRAAMRSISPGMAIDALISRDLAKYRQVRFAYRGALTISEPTTWPLVTFQGGRIANRMGLETTWRPVFLIADNGKCADSELVPTGIEATFVPLG